MKIVRASVVVSIILVCFSLVAFVWFSKSATPMALNHGLLKVKIVDDKVLISTFSSEGRDSLVPLQGADPKTFAIMNDFYAKDAVHVWYFNVEQQNSPVLLPVDPATFTIFDNTTPYTYTKDQSHVFWYVDVVSGANPATFSITQKDGVFTGYGKDLQHVYFKGKQLSQANPATFSLIDVSTIGVEAPEGYAKDSIHVYQNEKMVVGADPDSFMVFSAEDGETGYAKDSKHVFYLDKLLPEVDTNTFAVVDDSSGQIDAKDKNHIYFRGKVK